ncbi:MAG: ABC transporter permease [Myxococcota bacterium]
MKMLFLIAIRNILKARRRTILLSVAIGGVTLLLMLMLSLTEGIAQNVVKSATTLLSGHVNVAGFYKPTPSDVEPLVGDAQEIREIVRKETPGVEQVVDRTQGFATVVSQTDSLQSLIMGIDVEEETNFLDVIQLAPESAYVEGSESEELAGDPSKLTEGRTALIFASQAKRLGVGVGDQLTLRAETFSGTANTVDVTVVAIAKDVGLLSNFALFMPKNTLRNLYQLKEDTTGMVMAYLDDPDDAKEAMGDLRLALDDAGYRLMDHRPRPFFAKFESARGEDWTGQKLDLTTWEDQISFLELILTAINSVSFFIVAVLVVIIGVGMVNTMLMSIRERIGEIGTIRAMGMRRNSVLALFLIEAIILALTASLTGGLLGAGIALGLDAAQIHIPVPAVQAILLSDTLHLAVDPTDLVIAVVSITLFTGLAALWPALRAAKMQPVDAIRHTE